MAPILERHQVDLHLSGHDQNYERTYPLTEARGEPVVTSTAMSRYAAGEGVIYAKVSPSGKLSDRGKNFSRFGKEPPSHVAVRDDSAHHYALIDVKQTGELSVSVYKVAGDGTPKTLADQFSILRSYR